MFELATLTPMAWPVAELLPHGAPMILLDRVLAGDADRLVAEADLQEPNLFMNDGRIGAWVGIEYMAQAIAAWAGWQSRLRGETPQIGFLLGTRRYHSHKPFFARGETLHIRIARQFRADNGLGQFDACIQVQGHLAAQAALSVFEPPDVAAYLHNKEQSHG